MIRPASTVCALRPGADGTEVLMVRRGGQSVFMGGAYVFPGGAVDDVDDSELAAAAVAGIEDDDLAWRAAALRELAEEANLFAVTPPDLAPTLAIDLADAEGAELYRGVTDAGARFTGDALGYLSNWVTPPGPPRRFDTRFYVIALPEGTKAVADEAEVEDACWVRPSEALSRGLAGDWTLYFPTVKHLELLDNFERPEDAVTYAQSQERVPVVAPTMSRSEAGDVEVMMPTGHGFTTRPGGVATQ